MTDTTWTAPRRAHLPADVERRLKRLRRLATLMDAAIVIPGTRVRLGVDAAIGLIPGAGDAVSAAISSYIVIQAAQLGVPTPVLARMVLNIGIDFVIGTVPALGDAFDVLWRANLMNVDLIERHFGVAPPP
jgi:hypothetical protein